MMSNGITTLTAFLSFTVAKEAAKPRARLKFVSKCSFSSGELDK